MSNINIDTKINFKANRVEATLNKDGTITSTPSVFEDLSNALQKIHKIGCTELPVLKIISEDGITKNHIIINEHDFKAEDSKDAMILAAVYIINQTPISKQLGQSLNKYAQNPVQYQLSDIVHEVESNESIVSCVGNMVQSHIEL